MGITYNQEKKCFKLDSLDSTYMIKIVDDEGFIAHVYYGKKVLDEDLSYLLRINEYPFSPETNNRERVSFIDNLSMEYSTNGIGDFRPSCLMVETLNGEHACHLIYEKHNIFRGKKKINGLPTSFADEVECTTLELTCWDECIKLEVTLIYTVFEHLNVITRSVRIENHSDSPIYLEKALSMCLDIEGLDYDIITLHGSWARERRIQRTKIAYGITEIGSTRGVSSHQQHPFIAIVSRETSQDRGEVFGLSFVYSGNFIAQVEGTQFDKIRAVMGIHPENFRWRLEPEASFYTPEVIMVYSDNGLGQMTRTYHDFFRKHLIRSQYKDKQRPVLINNWEATYFDFNRDKLISIAKDAAELGIEMLVMDDGWFGKRDSDNCALGDWFVNEEKLGGTLESLVKEVNELGLKFGIWFEPEMISEDSELYRQHPDWAIRVQGRAPSLARNQLVLDYSREDVRNEIYSRMHQILKSANIEYVKWDMNRPLTDLYSNELPRDRQGELLHRYVLGLYDMLEHLQEEFPYLLIEGCSGGGGRFDPGILYYCPQIWCSDNTDAIERLRIQEGTALVYPLSAIGAHVSDCPNHTNGRITPFATRGYVAMAGTFGYELDVTKISDEEKKLIPQQIEMYHKYSELIRTGDYYRLASYSEESHYDAWEVVAKDKSEALVFYIQVLKRSNYHSTRLKLRGLCQDTFYLIEGDDNSYSGSALMNAGINVDVVGADFTGRVYHLLDVSKIH